MLRGHIAILLSLTLATAALGEQLAEVGKAGPSFRLPVYNAEPVGARVLGLDRYLGVNAAEKDVKVVLLSFMASFCAPCKKEMPWLQKLHERYREAGLRVVMVSIDSEPEGQKIIDELIALNSVTFPVLKDRFNLVARRWLGAKSPLPSAFLIGSDGLVKTVHRGYSEEVGTLLANEIEASLGVAPGSFAASLAESGSPEVLPASVAKDVTKDVTKKSAKKKGASRKKPRTKSTAQPQ